VTDDQAWAFRALARHAAAFGRWFAIFLGCALVYAVVACGMCACGENL
jgi:hypothetical protein